MVDFFIALFGGLYYGGKYLNEKSKSKAYDRRVALYNATRNRIESYVADYSTEQWAKNFVLSGKNYDKICDWFANDFRYVLGSDWKSKLQIPTHSMYVARGMNPWSDPRAHVMWVYHLVLARRGKIDSRIPSYGYPIGGSKNKKKAIKFAKRIEERLHSAGVPDVRLALELDMVGRYRRTPNDVRGGHIVIESLCHNPTHRLWED